MTMMTMTTTKMMKMMMWHVGIAVAAAAAATTTTTAFSSIDFGFPYGSVTPMRDRTNYYSGTLYAYKHVQRREEEETKKEGEKGKRKNTKLIRKN